jgi:hypothetical protein
MPKPKKGALNAKETVRLMAQLFDLCGIDRSPNRDRSRDGERFHWALYCAARDGLVRLPRKRGAPAKWKGQLGLDLIEAVESLQARSGPSIPKNKVALQKAVESLRAGTAPSQLKPLSVAKAIEALQDKDPKKWGGYDCDDLKKRYHEAKKVWGYGTRLMMLADPWHKKHPENS